MVTAKQASIEFALQWQCVHARHTDRLYLEKVNFWRDFFPGALGDQLAGLSPGQSASQSFAAGELVPAYDLHLVHRIRPSQMSLRLRTGEPVTPRVGRYYPRGMVSGLPDVFSGDWRPMRFLGGDDSSARVDLNHPLARYPLTVEGCVVAPQGELHPFERQALVLDYFRRSGGFVYLHTESLRGLPRPADDQYVDQFALSDPVYAVWGRRTS